MTRLQKTALVVLVALPLLFAAGLAALYGVANSERGSRFLLSQAETLVADTVTWKSAEGSLLDSLELRGIQISQPDLDVEIDSVAITWHPTALLGRVLWISALNVEGVRITQRASEDSQPSIAFDPGTLRLPVAVRLDDVVLRNIALIDAAGMTQPIDRVILQANLSGDQFDLSQLTIELPQGNASLALQTQLNTLMPVDLKASWDWQQVDTGASAPMLPNSALSGDVNLSGTLDWHRGIAFELSYAVAISGLGALSSELPERAAIEGVAAGVYLDDALELENLTLALVESPGQLSVAGRVSQLAAEEPAMTLRLAWTDVQWPLVSARPQYASAQGELTFDGLLNDYQLGLFARVSGAEIPTSSWRVQGAGDLQHLNLQQLQGELLGGQVSVVGPVWWEPLPAWQLAVELADIDPGSFNPDFPGLLAGSLSSTGSLDAANTIAAGVDVQRLTGEMIGYPFELTTQAQLQGEQVTLTQLSLSSGDNRVEASGQLSEQVLDIAWQLRANEPELFVPGASGTAEASGTVRGSATAPVIQTKASAALLALDTLSLSELSIDAQLGLAADDPLQLIVVTGPVRSGGETVLDAMRLQASGTTGKHTLMLDLDTALVSAQSVLEGGVTDDLAGWAGKLVELALRNEAVGSWQLREPSALALSADAAELGETCLALEDAADTFCVMGNWTQTGGSLLEATLESLSVARWVPALSGDVSGELSASLAADGQIRGDTKFRMTSGAIEVPLDSGSKQLPHGGGTLEAVIDQRGLSAHAQFDAQEQGKLQANLSLPGLTTLALLDSQPLVGRVEAMLPDLRGFAAWIPEVSSIAGALGADLTLAGTFAAPELTGELTLEDGAADVPSAGIKLRNIAMRAVSDASQPERMLLTGGLDSGQGSLALSGELDWVNSAVDVKLTGDRLMVFNTPDARVVVAPDVDIAWKDETLVLRGDVRVPRADITPKLSLSQTAAGDDMDTKQGGGQVIAASPDVVVINRAIELPADGVTSAISSPPMRIDSQLRLILGDRVRINSLGFISSITGDVMFTNRPDQLELIPMANGTLSIEDGTFRAFGQDLEIEEGRIIFANVPATEPELNLRAVRWIDNDPTVSAAGVLLTGSVAAPELTLFSRPQLETSDIQSYLLTGRSAGDQESVLSIGTYVTRRLYVGYGFNLLYSTSEFNSLFSITPRYGVGADFGEADNNVNVTFTHER